MKVVNPDNKEVEVTELKVVQSPEIRVRIVCDKCQNVTSKFIPGEYAIKIHTKEEYREYWQYDEFVEKNPKVDLSQELSKHG